MSNVNTAVRHTGPILTGRVGYGRVYLAKRMAVNWTVAVAGAKGTAGKPPAFAFLPKPARLADTEGK